MLGRKRSSSPFFETVQFAAKRGDVYGGSGLSHSAGGLVPGKRSIKPAPFGRFSYCIPCHTQVNPPMRRFGERQMHERRAASSRP
jgi:hypothetical protein